MSEEKKSDVFNNVVNDLFHVGKSFYCVGKEAASELYPIARERGLEYASDVSGVASEVFGFASDKAASLSNYFESKLAIPDED